MRSKELLLTFGNPSAVHHELGQRASRLTEEARSKIASEFDVSARQVVFTASASEANNLVITGFWLRFFDRGCRVIYSAIEHKSALEPAKRIGEMPGGESVELGVDSSGVINLGELKALLLDNPRRLPTLVVVMHCNNEIPTRQPVEEIAALCEEHRVYFHCDAVQGFVREKISFRKVNFGTVVVSPHKVSGPKGIGLLIVGDGAAAPPITPLLLGGEQESGVRPGTLNTAAICAAALACETHAKSRAQLLDHLRICENLFCAEMKKLVPGFHLTVPPTQSCPGIVNFYIENIDAPSLLQKLPTVCLNRGASCTGAGGEKFSHVPKALGLPIEIQANVLRASFGWGCSVEEIPEAVARIVSAVSVTRLQQMGSDPVR